ncbi:MAG: hypothetical protein RR646_01395 [Erysipelotrichaceae bacterium]
MFKEGRYDEEHDDDEIEKVAPSVEVIPVSRIVSSNSNESNYRNKTAAYAAELQREKEITAAKQSVQAGIDSNLVKEKYEEVKPKSKSIDIKVDDYDEPAVRKESKSNALNAKAVNAKANVELNINQVISPIFGSKEAKEELAKPKAVKPIIKKNPINTVISPIYGASQLDEFAAAAQEKLAKASEKKVTTTNDYLIDDEDVVNLDIEDILSKNTKSTNDDLVQCSLFGDDALIGENSDLNKDAKIER